MTPQILTILLILTNALVYSFVYGKGAASIRGLTKHEQTFIRKLQQKEGLSKNIKTIADKVVCFHYIPLALSESYRFTRKYCIDRSMWEEYNAVAVNGLIRGVSKYDWNRKHTNLPQYLLKYIQYELYHSQNKYATLYDEELLEWKLHSPPDDEVTTYYDILKTKILFAANRLSPNDRRLFFQIYDKETLQRTSYNTNALCQLAGIQNPETLRQKMNGIVSQIKQIMDDQPDDVFCL